MRREYLLRLGALAGILSSAVFLVASAALLPAYLASEQNKKGILAELTVAEASAKKEMENAIGREITLAGEALPLLEGALAAPRPSNYVEEIIAVRTPAISLTRLEFFSGKVPSVRVGGQAQTREALIEFSRRLSEIPGSPQVDLPVSNLAKSVNVPFTLTVSFLQ